MKLNKKRKGFTLVELIVVVVILGILMGIGALKYADVRRNTNLKTLQANHKTLVSALQLQMATNGGAIPSSVNDKATMLALTTGIADGAPVGSTYDFANGTVTTTVSNHGNDYPEDNGSSVSTITLTTNVLTGAVHYAPNEAYFNK